MEDRFEQLIDQILTTDDPAKMQLMEETDALLDILCQVTGIDVAVDTLGMKRHSKTGFGHAVNLITAARCVKEQLRSKVFLRGIHQAIEDRLKTEPLPLKILYAGTGPFGWLILPLLTRYSPDQVQVTLIEIHQEALDALQKVIDFLGVRDRIAEQHCTNLFDWPLPADKTYDLIVSETMAAHLKTEPQVSVFRYLIPTLKESGTLIPEVVDVSVSIVAPERHALEPIFLQQMLRLDRTNARALSEGDETCLYHQSTVPDYPDTYLHLMLDTVITVYKSHILNRRHCSLTSPLTVSRAAPKIGSPFSTRYLITDSPDYEINYVSSLSIEHEEPAAFSDRSCLDLPFLQRFWEKCQLGKEGRLDKQLQETEWQLTCDVFEALGIEFLPSLPEIYGFERKAEFEAFMREKVDLSSPDVVAAKVQDVWDHHQTTN